MSWRKRRTIGKSTALGAAMLFCALTAAGVIALESDVFSLKAKTGYRIQEFSGGFVAGKASNIPYEVRSRMDSGWSGGVARVTGPRHLQIGDEEFTLAYVDTRRGALRELERIADGQWVACLPIGQRGREAECTTERGDSLSHAMIWSGTARATPDAPLGLKVADSMRWKG